MLSELFNSSELFQAFLNGIIPVFTLTFKLLFTFPFLPFTVLGIFAFI